MRDGLVSSLRETSAAFGIGERLFARMPEIVPLAAYPSGMTALPVFNPKPGFFPGTNGRWGGALGLPVRLMFVGQDYGTTEDFKDALPNGEDPSGPTWRGIDRLLRDARISRSECFFTNAVMGVRTGERNTGRSPAFRQRSFVDRCVEFLEFQFSVVRPHGTVLLGTAAAEVFARLVYKQADWPGALGFHAWDQATRLRPLAALVGGVETKVVRLLHPSVRDGNLWRRIERSLGIRDKNDAHLAEVQLLRSAYE